MKLTWSRCADDCERWLAAVAADRPPGACDEDDDLVFWCDELWVVAVVVVAVAVAVA